MYLKGIAMSIIELIEKAKISATKRTQQDRKKLLIKAHVLDSNGIYDSRYFSEQTVNKSKVRKAS